MLLKMPIVYVAGPFRAPTPWQVELNVRAAETLGLAVAERGAMPLIPHANTRFFNGLLTDEFWLEGTLALLRRCDAVMLVTGWERSIGTHGEIAEARERGMSVFEDTAEQWTRFDQWLLDW